MPEPEKSEYSIFSSVVGFCHAFEKEGGTSKDLVKIGKSRRILRGILGVLRGTWKLEPIGFPVWRQVKIGVYGSEKAFITEVDRLEYRIGMERFSNVYPTDFEWQQSEGEICLIKVLDIDLGFTGRYKLDELTASAARYGLCRISAETAASLRLQYTDQPVDETLYAAMDPIGREGKKAGIIFTVENPKGRCPCLSNIHPHFGLESGRTWIFALSPSAVNS